MASNTRCSAADEAVVLRAADRGVGTEEISLAR
jgi:hypothetical protein